MGALADGVRNALLDAVARNVSYANAAVWVQLHTGAPGSAGTSNVASNSTRKQATFGSAASGGTIANTVVIEWTTVPTTENYTYVSLWSASSGGTLLGTDDLGGSTAVTSGDTFRLAAGDLVLGV